MLPKQFYYKRNIIQQLKGFYYAAQIGSISKAAKKMGLTQAAVTLQIQSLERDLNLQLFNRNSKPLSLTDEGVDFYKIACPLIQEFESVVDKFLKERNRIEEKTINIAVHHIAISYLMPKIVASFKKLYPESKIVIKNISLDDATQRIKDNKIDLAFYPASKHDPEIKYVDAVSYDPILIMHKNHHFAKREIESLSDLKKLDLIKIDRNLITLPLFEEVVKKYNLKGSVEFENGNWEMLKHFVKENDFVALVSTICLDENDKNLAIKNLSNFFPKMNYSVMHKNGMILKKITQDFIATIDEFAKKSKYSEN